MTTVTIKNITATIETDWTVSISDAESHELGTGWWDGCIQDVPVDLGDEVYEALDEALIDAGAPKEWEDTGIYVFETNETPRWLAVQTNSPGNGNMTYGVGNSRRDAIKNLAVEPADCPIECHLAPEKCLEWYCD